MTILYPPLQPGQVGKLAYAGNPTLAHAGPCTLQGAATANFGSGNTGTCQVFDAASAGDAVGRTPVATLAANTSTAGMGIAIARGVVVAPAPYQQCSVALQLPA